MKKLYLLTSLLLIIFYANAQDNFEIGQTVGSEYIITCDTAVLRKALQRTLGDGTQISAMRIESVNAFHYLIGNGLYRGYAKMIATQLFYDMKSRSFFAKPMLAHVVCSSAACDNCTPFKEKGKIIGCKCAEKSTVSNQCNFSAIDQSSFYDNLKRYQGMKK